MAGVTAEVTYHFIRGHGWVPETPLSLKLSNEYKNVRQAAKAMNFGTPAGYLNGRATHTGYNLERMQNLQAQMMRDAARYWAGAAPAPREPEPPRQVTTTAAPDGWYSVCTGYGNQIAAYQSWIDDPIYDAGNYFTGRNAAPRQTPRERTRTPEAPTNTRYFPGSRVAPEASTENNESVHDRRLREYRDAVRRFRHG